MIHSMKVNKTAFIAFVLTLMTVEPGYFTTFSAIHNLYKSLTFVALGIVILHIVKLGKRYRPSACMILIAALFIELIFVTQKNGGAVIPAIRYSVNCITILLLVDSCDAKHIKNAIKGIKDYVQWVVIINFMTILLFPNGLYSGDKSATEKYYFWGHNNSAVKIIIPAIVLSLIYDLVEYKKITKKTWIFSLIGFGTVTLTWSNTGMVGIAIILIGLLFQGKFTEKATRIPGIAYVLTPVVLFVVFIVQQRFGIFEYIITSVFHKSMNMTGRTTIWSSAIPAIMRNPIWGYGYGVRLNTIVNLAFDPSSCHNYFLDLLVRGGAVQLAIQLIINSICCFKIKKGNASISYVILIALVSYFVIWQVEAFISVGVPLMYLVFLLCYKKNELFD